MKYADFFTIQHGNYYPDDKKLKRDIRLQMIFRYSTCSFATFFLYIFREQLPFPFPHFFFVSCIVWLINGLLHLLSLKKSWALTAYGLFPYSDALTAPFIFQFSGGFLSPFIIAHLATNIAGGIIYTRAKHCALHTYIILLTSYFSIAFLQKFNILPCMVGYSETMLANDSFFLFVVLITSTIITGSYVLIRFFHFNVHQTLDNMARSFDGIVKGTIATVGQDFFIQLVKNLSESLKMRCAMIAELTHNNASLRCLAVWKDAKTDENFDNPVNGTVFADVLSQKKYLLDTNVEALFQSNPLLAQCKAVFFCGVLLYDSKGKPIGVLCIVNDQPAQNRYMIEPLITIFASRASAELERKLTEERQKMIEVQLAHAHKMQAIGKLVGGIAHDFNNFVSAVGGCAQLLKMKIAADSPHQRYINHILEAGRHSSELINRLMSFSRRDQPHIVPVDVHKVIDETCALLEGTTNSNITIIKKCSASKSITASDDSMLQNALLNLAINARDAMEKNGGTLTFETELITLEKHNYFCQSFLIEAGEYIRVNISDTGVGMSDSVQRHLFEPFFTTKPKGKGIGLGLASVWGFVENYKCAISVKSNLGTGSCFSLYIPLMRPVAFQHDKPAIAGSSLSSIANDIKNVLVVDDEENQREITSEILSSKGFSVILKENGLEGVNYFKENNAAVDLIVLDMRMPVMDGHQAFYEIRKIKKDVKIIIATGFIEEKDLDGILQEPKTKFLQKPFTKDMLLNTIKELYAKAG